MRASATVVGLTDALKTAEIKAMMAAMKSMSRAQEDLKEDLRDQVRGAGMGDRLARTWQGKVYPIRGNSLSPAAYVYSKAPGIIDAYARGTTIYPRAGRRFLAIPTDAVPRRRSGRAMTPQEVESRYGRRLRFVPSHSAQGSAIKGRAVGYLLMDELVHGQRTGNGYRRASARERAGRSRQKTRPVQSVVMFTLVGSVKKPKRLDLQGALNRAAATLPQLLAENWSDG